MSKENYSNENWKFKEKLEDNFVLFFDSKLNMELDKTISTEIQIGFERNC